MENTIVCENCETINILIESRLFFPEEKHEAAIPCSQCRSVMKTEFTDGWFLIQTKEQFLFEQEIELQKKEL